MDGDYNNSYRRNSNGKWIDSSDDVLSFVMQAKEQRVFHTEDKVYDGIAKVNILGAVAETISFLVDGKSFIGCRQLNYISNSLCFIGTVSMGLLWCLYVNLRIYRNFKKISEKWQL